MRRRDCKLKGWPLGSGLPRGVAMVGVVVSAVLATVKIGVGLSANSISVVSDGMESGADVVTSGLIWLGLWIAAKPADHDHP